MPKSDDKIKPVMTGGRLFNPDPIDVHVGGRVRVRRKMMSLSQTQLGKELGITFQQIQKYERGTNRIGSSRLFRTAIALDVQVAYFFEGAETKLPGYAAPSTAKDVFERPETLELIEAYYSIADPRLRGKVLAIARTLGHDEYS